MRLQTRISLAAVLLVIATGVSVGLLSMRELRTTLDEEHGKWTATMSRAVAKAIIKGTLQYNTVEVRDVLRRVQESNDDLSYLLVVDFKGNIFTSTFEGKIPAVLAGDHHDCQMGRMSELRVNGQLIDDISYPLIQGLQAHLHIGLHSDREEAVLDSTSRTLAWSVFGISLLGALGALFIGRRISRPITKLSSDLYAYGRGESLSDLSETHARDREIHELMNSFKDMVEERAHSEQELQARTKQLDSVVNVSPVVLFSCDKHGLFTMSEGAALKSLGWKPGQVVGQSLFDVYAEAPEMVRAARRVLAGESLVQTSEQAGRVFETHWSPLLDKEDRVDGILGVAVDITERQRAEEELRQLNEALEARVDERTAKVREQATILDQIHDSVVMTDLNGVITSWNKGAERLFGYTAKEAIGKNISVMYPEEEQQFLQDRVITPLQEKGEHEVEVTMLRKGGQSFFAHLSLSLMRDKQGNPVSMVGYALDITERKRAEQRIRDAMQQAEEASHAKSEFLSRMSHELRTPMNAILGFSQLLEQNLDGNMSEAELEYVDEVLKGGRHLLDLINEVLDLSRIESGKMQISLETVELNDLVDECVNLVRPMAEQNRITITSPESRDTILVTADRMRLKQVILNLLSNAVKYNRIGGEVELECEKTDGWYRVSIRDTGPGIPEHLQSRVFDPFDRLNADSSNVEGTGIGLSLAKRLTEFMGGRIGFSSTEGEGSTFWVELEEGAGMPVVPLEEASPALEQSGNGEKRHKVLYVEDNPANLRLIAQLIEKHGGIQLYDTHSASLALDLIGRHKFELILLDIHLAGEESGFDVLSRLRSDPALREIPVVAISANATPGDVQRGLEAGFLEYITKPIDVYQFHAVLERYLGKDGQA
jgi:PAS domain S-box-containing protein